MRACNKVGWGSEDVALAFLVNNMKSGEYGRAYRCPKCRCWHLTTQKKRDRKAGR
jgi:hypothetical protein